MKIPAGLHPGSKLNNIGMVVDLGPLTRLMIVKGKFDAEKGAAPTFQGPELEFSDALQPVIDILQILLMLQGGFSKKSALGLAFLAAAVTTPLGTAVSYPVVSRIDPPVLGALLSLSAGALIYVGATHLLPRTEREPRRFSLVALGGGIAVAIVIIMSKG